jgi:hypothetical protein
MLNQILIHTPMYVWAILAFLVWRGMVEMRGREVPLRRLFILPLAMLGLALVDLVAKFGVAALPMAAWMAGCAASLFYVRSFGAARIVAGAAAGQVRLRGSKAPLAAMIGLLLLKYATSVVLVVQPEAARIAPVAAAMCAAFGLFNGWFLGRLARDLAALRELPGEGAATPVPLRLQGSDI